MARVLLIFGLFVAALSACTSSPPSGGSPREDTLRVMKGRTVDLSFDGEKLPEIIAAISEQTHVPLQVNSHVKQPPQGWPKTTWSVKDLVLADSLRLVLSRHDLAYYVDDKGVVVVYGKDTLCKTCDGSGRISIAMQADTSRIYSTCKECNGPERVYREPSSSSRS